MPEEGTERKKEMSGKYSKSGTPGFKGEQERELKSGQSVTIEEHFRDL
jgi:hypothetical protein